VSSRRFTILIADRSTGVVRRFTVSLRPTLALVALVLGLPVLVGLGARWSARAEIAALRTTAVTLEAENNIFRGMSKELTDQIGAVQDAVTHLSEESKLDPDSARALARLPAFVRTGAMGGANSANTPIARSVLSPSLASPEDTFGMLRELLGRLGSSLDLVRDDVEKRAALAAATPSVWPALGPLTASYGRREDPFTGSAAHHSGIDISTRKGQAACATAAGTVESASWNGDYGKMVVLDHGFGLKTRYGHLDGYAVKVGDRVERMQVIGYVGSTGRATGPHLHYEMLVNGRLTDPLRLLRDPRR
jgi:murein DD-endopeptidase MepM/ murein hydrolase activator NlpD